MPHSPTKIKAFLLICSMLAPATAKRAILSARDLKLLDDSETEFLITILGLTDA